MMTCASGDAQSGLAETLWSMRATPRATMIASSTMMAVTSVVARV